MNPNVAGFGFVVLFIASIVVGGFLLKHKKKSLALASPWFFFLPISCIFIFASGDSAAGGGFTISLGVIGAQLRADDGNVRRMGVPNLVIGKDGQPTPQSMEVLRKALAKKSGKKTRAELTCDADVDEKKVYEYAMSVANNQSRPKYSWKPWSSNQCRTFAKGAFGAGR